MTALSYRDFLEAKSQLGSFDGFDPGELPSFLFDFQQSLVAWALRKGKSLIAADCGLGKSPMLLSWAQAIVRRENRSVLVLSPLAVAAQTLREAEKFGIEAVRSSDGRIPHGASIVLTNYERLHYFDPSDFAGVVCDESSILMVRNVATATLPASEQASLLEESPFECADFEHETTENPEEFPVEIGAGLGENARSEGRS